MAQTFRPFACDWPLASTGLPSTEPGWIIPATVPILSWIVLSDGEPLIINGDFTIVDAPYISCEYSRNCGARDTKGDLY